MFRIYVILGVLLLAGCGEPFQEHGSRDSRHAVLPAAPEGPDFRDLLDGYCHASRVQPVALNDYEYCFASELSAQCSPANDCLVTCLVSGQGRQEGGGCWHLCFEDLATFNAYREPIRAARCRRMDPFQPPGKFFRPAG